MLATSGCPKAMSTVANRESGVALDRTELETSGAKMISWGETPSFNNCSAGLLNGESEYILRVCICFKIVISSVQVESEVTSSKSGLTAGSACVAVWDCREEGMAIVSQAIHSNGLA